MDTRLWCKKSAIIATIISFTQKQEKMHCYKLKACTHFTNLKSKVNYENKRKNNK